MPTPIEQTISIILDPASKLRDASPLVYCVPTDSVDQHEPRMRYFDLPDGDLSKTMRRWMMTEYGDALLQSEPIEDNADQSEIFAYRITLGGTMKKLWSNGRTLIDLQLPNM